ncbi:hypothetical protein BD626DRAFT_258406 [Schizophyllum amplum]|uniref:Uncharacterized protein n=1 Tax=Schizophyllum amplum TaxID=97359 RepID=A0A550BUP8_9AGAR|nr:hypothetical protein BD626DRAFT_258406 [Auriculariopsis ampla]
MRWRRCGIQGVDQVVGQQARKPPKRFSSDDAEKLDAALNTGLRRRGVRLGDDGAEAVDDGGEGLRAAVGRQLYSLGLGRRARCRRRGRRTRQGRHCFPSRGGSSPRCSRRGRPPRHSWPACTRHGCRRAFFIVVFVLIVNRRTFARGRRCGLPGRGRATRILGCLPPPRRPPREPQ